jgi:hypothetical protein
MNALLELEAAFFAAGPGSFVNVSGHCWNLLQIWMLAVPFAVILRKGNRSGPGYIHRAG